MLHFSFLAIAWCVVPVSPEKYKALSLKNALRKNVVEVFLLPRPLTEASGSDRLDIEDFVESTETDDVDKFDGLNLDRKYNLYNNLDLYEIDDYNARDRIVDGVDVEISMFPYHVGYGVNCGGAIIGPKWVLTAAHCGNKVYIRSGSRYINRGKQTKVLINHVHPMWSREEKEHPFDFDFQILELEEELIFDENTQPIKVAKMSHMVVGKMVTVTGWGHTKEAGSYSSVLKAVSVPIIQMDICQKVPFPYFQGKLTPRMFCAGYRDGTKDACQGDSGGPAVADERLFGMVSFGFGCATPDFYGVYSKVAKVRDWIKSVTRINMD